MTYSMFISDDFSTYGNSLLYPSGIEIASLSCEHNGKKFWVSLQTQGSVCIVYRGETYKHISQFPQELIDLIKSGEFADLVNKGEIDLRENNWWEWCLSDGDGDVLEIDPCDYKNLGAVAGDMISYLTEMVNRDNK